MNLKRQNTTCYVDERGLLEAVDVTLVVEDGRIGRDYGDGVEGSDYDGVEWYSVMGTTTLRGWGKDDGEAVVLDSPRPLIVPSGTLGVPIANVLLHAQTQHGERWFRRCFRVGTKHHEDTSVSDLLLLGDLACSPRWRTHVESF